MEDDPAQTFWSFAAEGLVDADGRLTAGGWWVAALLTAVAVVPAGFGIWTTDLAIGAIGLVLATWAGRIAYLTAQDGYRLRSLLLDERKDTEALLERLSEASSAVERLEASVDLRHLGRIMSALSGPYIWSFAPSLRPDRSQPPATRDQLRKWHKALRAPLADAPHLCLPACSSLYQQLSHTCVTGKSVSTDDLVHMIGAAREEIQGQITAARARID